MTSFDHVRACRSGRFIDRMLQQICVEDEDTRWKLIKEDTITQKTSFAQDWSFNYKPPATNNKGEVILASASQMKVYIRESAPPQGDS